VSYADRRHVARLSDALQVCPATKNYRQICFGLPIMREDLASIHLDNLVDDIMSRSPQTIRVFLRFKMRCVGCPIACFHTVDDACREHGVDREAFLAALNAYI
jgi:hybrid cluster-associated redox disulfide protein